MPAPVSSPGSTPADRWRRLRAGLEAQGALDPAAAGLIAFARATFPGYRPAPHHRKIAEALEAVARGDCRRLMIFMPPRHGKSELASVRFPPWYLGTYPDRRIIAASYAASLAYRFSRQARNLLTLPAYHRLFPAISVAGDAGAVQQWDIAGHRGGYLAAGVGGPLTGQGANLLLVDDPVKSRAEADSPTIRDTVWDWYQGTAYTRLEDDAAIVLVQTRWHEDDLAGRLLREQGQGGDRWEVLNLPALAEAGDPLGRAPGEALWPEKYDQAELGRIKVAVGSRNWQSLYQGAPTSEHGGLFKRHWWRRYGAFDRTQAREVIQLWDTAFSERTSADYSVCATWAQTDTGYYVLDVWRGQIGFPDLKRLAVDLFGRWHPAAILVEAKASGISLIQELQRETVLPVVAVPVSAADGDKVARANAAAPTVEAGRVYLPETAPWVHDFIEEHASFPLGAHDDMVDTTSMALHRWVGFNDVASFLAAMRGSTN